MEIYDQPKIIVLLCNDRRVLVIQVIPTAVYRDRCLWLEVLFIMYRICVATSHKLTLHAKEEEKKRKFSEAGMHESS